MTDMNVDGGSPSTILTVAISKGRSGSIDVDTARLPEYIYIQCLKEGAKILVNKGMSKLDKEDKDGIIAQAEKNLKAMYEGTMVIRGSKAKGDKVPTEVMTIARNMARAIVKAELKKKGFKVSLVKSSVITKAANALLTQRPDIVQKAYADYEAQSNDSAGDVLAGIQEDPGLKAKAAKAKAEKQLSAAKAGKVASRGRGVPLHS